MKPRVPTVVVRDILLSSQLSCDRNEPLEAAKKLDRGQMDGRAASSNSPASLVLDSFLRLVLILALMSLAGAKKQEPRAGSRGPTVGPRVKCAEARVTR